MVCDPGGEFDERIYPSETGDILGPSGDSFGLLVNRWVETQGRKISVKMMVKLFFFVPSIRLTDFFKIIYTN